MESSDFYCVPDYGGILRENWEDFLRLDREYKISSLMNIEAARKAGTGSLCMTSNGKEYVIGDAIPTEVWIHAEKSFCSTCKKLHKVRTRKIYLDKMDLNARCRSCSNHLKTGKSYHQKNKRKSAKEIESAVHAKLADPKWRLRYDPKS